MRVLTVYLLAFLLVQSTLAAPWQRVISYGADLTPEDRVTVVRDFNLPPEVNPGQIPSITVQHSEELDLLGRVAPPEIIGNLAVSSVYIEALSAGSGLQVAEKNITWVTPAIYANAMATGGVADAKVIVTAPVPVSGTAALTGIFKAFAYMSGRSPSSAARDAAADEMIRTGELGQSFGSDTAATFMEKTKESVVQSKAATYEQVRTIVIREAKTLNLNLTEVQTRQVVDVMLRISKLGLGVDTLRAQLKNFKPEEPSAGMGGLLARMLTFLQSLFKQLFGFVSRYVRG